MRGVLHAVAQTNHFDTRCSRYGPTQHAHGVYIIQQYRLWAQLFHVFTNIKDYRNGAQATHDSTDSQSVGNGLF